MSGQYRTRVGKPIDNDNLSPAISRRSFLRASGVVVAAAFPLGLAACSTDAQPEVAPEDVSGESVLSLFDPLRPPAQLTLSCRTVGTLTASWSEGSTDVGTPRYAVFVGDRQVLQTEATSCELPELTDGVEHAVRVITIDEAGTESAPTATLVRTATAAVDADNPDVPPFLTATAAAGAIQFRWAHPGRNGSAPAGRYELFRVGNPRSVAVMSTELNSDAAPAISILLTGCIPYKIDEFYLVALGNDSKPIGEARNRVRVGAYTRAWPKRRSVPLAPDGLSSKVDTTGVALEWTQPSETADLVYCYNIYVDGMFIGRTVASTSTSIPVVSNVLRYAVSLTAVDFSGYASEAASLEILLPEATVSSATPSTLARFTNTGADIIDPDGKKFIPVGVNMSGMDYVWNEEVLGKSNVASDIWRWNTIRLCCGMSDWGSISGGYIFFRNNNLKRIVEEYTSSGIVIIITQFSKGNTANATSSDGLYNAAPASSPDGSGRSVEDAVTDWWVEIAKMFVDNPWVWINLINEPGPDFGNLDAMYRRMLARIRAIAPLMPVVLDAANFANDIPNRATIGAGPIGDTDSFVLSKGAALAADFGVDKGFGPIIFSIHAYSRWPVNYGGQDVITDEQLANRMRAFASRAREMGLPVLVGETGVEEMAQEYDSASVRVGLYEQGNLDGREVGVWQEQGIGVLVWHASPSSGMAVSADGGPWSSVTDVSMAAPSPDAGVGLWNYSHSKGS